MADLARSHARFLEAVRARGLARTAENTGGTTDGAVLHVPMAGRTFVLDPMAGTVAVEDADGTATPAGFVESVVVATYAGTADGTPPTGTWVSEKGLVHGDAYFRPPHTLPTVRLGEVFGSDPDAFLTAAKALGGEETGQGDRGVEIPALPRVPVRLTLWLGDDEFPDTDVRVLFDRNATSYLILDGVLALLNVVVKAMIEAAGRMEAP